MVTSASQTGLEVNDETEVRPIPAKGGVDTMATESTTEEAVKASDLRFFWVEGGGAHEDYRYHWCLSCPGVTNAVWHGGRLVSSENPPPGVADMAWMTTALVGRLEGPAWHSMVVDPPTDGTNQKRYLCGICANYYPSPKADPCPDEWECCEKCGCARAWHTLFDLPLRHEPSHFACWMTWDDVIPYDEREFGQASLSLYCPCDGYEPPAGGRPLTPSDFAADGLAWRGD